MKRAATLIDYFENDLAPPEAEALALLFAVKLRQTGRTVRLVSRCCHSILAIDHPYYGQNVVNVNRDACDLVAPRIAPLCRLFTRGWDVASDGELPAETAELEESKAKWDAYAQIVKRPRGPATGVRIQDILRQLPAVTVLGLAVGVRLPAGKARPN